MSNGGRAKYFVNGISLREYCGNIGIRYPNVYRIMKTGLSVEEAINAVKQKNERKVSFVYNGYKLSAFCNRKQINYQSVLGRISQGLSIEEAINRTEEVERPERLKRRRRKERKMALIKQKEHDEEIAKKSIKVSASEKKKSELINSIHNLKSMIRYLDVGSIDYNNAKNTIKSLEKELKDLGK